jgi:hypothetical protein
MPAIARRILGSRLTYGTCWENLQLRPHWRSSIPNWAPLVHHFVGYSHFMME